MIRSTIAALGLIALAAIPSGVHAQGLITLDATAVAAVPSQTTPEKITLRPLLQPGGDVVAARVWLPANTDIPPHTHPAGKVAIVTLVSGDLKVGLGDKFDEAALKPIASGGVIVFRDADPKHFARTGNAPVELLLMAAPKASVVPAWQGGK